MLEKKYNHQEVEKNKYDNWKNNGYFKTGQLSKTPFCIVIPPPNVTGRLSACRMVWRYGGRA